MCFYLLPIATKDSEMISWEVGTGNWEEGLHGKWAQGSGNKDDMGSGHREVGRMITTDTGRKKVDFRIEK